MVVKSSGVTEMDPIEAASGGTDTQDQQDKRVADLSRESAAYRVQRNTAVRQAHGFKTMLAAHGIDTAGVTAEKLDAIPISGGVADGRFDYTPPEIKVPVTKPTPRVGDESVKPTLDDVKNWSVDEINSRWDEVSALMAGGNK